MPIPQRIIRAFAVIAVGIVVFFARPFVAPDRVDAEGLSIVDAAATRALGCISAGERDLCGEPAVVIGTAVLAALAIGGGKFRPSLVSLAFIFPPMLIYITIYPIWIVLMMLLLMPVMAHAALNAWLPEAAESA